MPSHPGDFRVLSVNCVQCLSVRQRDSLPLLSLRIQDVYWKGPHQCPALLKLCRDDTASGDFTGGAR